MQISLHPYLKETGGCVKEHKNNDSPAGSSIDAAGKTTCAAVLVGIPLENNHTNTPSSPPSPHPFPTYEKLICTLGASEKTREKRARSTLAKKGAEEQINDLLVRPPSAGRGKKKHYLCNSVLWNKLQVV